MRATLSHKGRHVSSGDLLDPIEHCPICLHAGARPSILRIQRAPDVHMLECSRCRGCSASQMPRPEYLFAYYRTYFDHTDCRVTFGRIAYLARHIVRRIKSGHSGGVVRILDFGGGDGSLALAIADQLSARDSDSRVEVLVVDYQLRDPFTAGRISLSHASDLVQVEGQFNIVLASAILEHIPELHSVLHRLLKVVAPEGYFYARTPWAVPLARLVPGVNLTYPGHVHDLGAAFWNRAAEIFAFEGSYLLSGPSPVATRVLTHPLRTVVAYVAKLPAQLESLASSAERTSRVWRLAGGWEVLLQRRERLTLARSARHHWLLRDAW
jgi:SAM-dependent methyltransferase